MILLDTHVFLGFAGLTETELPLPMLKAIENEDKKFISVASLWELSIKYQLGKIKIAYRPIELLPLLQNLRIRTKDITSAHAFAGPAINVPTKDPFDRLLLGICKVEKMKLMTLDRALLDHPLVWKPKRARSSK